MKIKEIEGIVISTTKYKETSKIINVFTNEGIIGIISKGCLKIKSKLRVISNKLIYGKFYIYYKEEGLSTLIEGDVINSWDNILKDLTRISFASYIIDLVVQTYRQNDNLEIYEILINGLKKIDEGLNPLFITNIIEIKMLDYLGVGLNLKECNGCGNDEIVNLSVDAGGYVCKDCLSDNDYKYSEKTIKVIKLYQLIKLENVKNIKLESKTIEEINKFLTDYYEKYTGLYLKSKKFLNKIPQFKEEEL